MHEGKQREDIFRKILDSAFFVHTELGPGLLESAYEHCLHYDLSRRGIRVERQKGMPLYFCETKMDLGYRLDLLVEDEIVVEIKAVESLNDVHLAQILTYLKISGCTLGLLVNFNCRHLKNGIRRVIR
ncbi:MAG TPA: GxxExxY protein [Bacteroidales bacterium]|nr:GxxExxY protein [Bacteroidales bacterium]HPS63344.1 GxxExxY protein [Bacteroidales bacterium]